jgi:hypothetical protein
MCHHTLDGVNWAGLLELAEPDHGLWTFHQPLSVLGAQIGCRMTALRLGSGDLLLHSPIRLTAELRSRLDQLGPVRHVLAPNLDHYLFARDYREPYPEALFYAAPGVQTKLPELRFDVLLEHPRIVAASVSVLDLISEDPEHALARLESRAKRERTKKRAAG